MSQKNSKFIPLQDKGGPIFQGGVDDNFIPQVLSYKNSKYGRNFRVNAFGITVRPGYYSFASLSGTGDKPFGIGSYTRSASTNNRIVVGYKNDATHYLVTLDSAGTQVNIATAALITVETRMNFLSANDAVYCMNGVDLYGKLSGTTYTNPASGIATFKPSFGVFFGNSGWVSGNSADPTKLYKSTTNNLDTYTGTGSDTFTAAYPIKGLGVNQQSLYVFTDNGIDVFNQNSINQVGASLVYISKPLETTEGCSNNNLIVSVGKGIFYITPSRKIRRINPNSFGMYDFTELSHRSENVLSNTMDSLDPDQSAGFGYAIPGKQIICWSLKSKGASYNDTVITYNYEFDEWMIDTNKSFAGGVLFDNNPYTISALQKSVYRDEYGDTDDDSPIQFRYDSKLMDFGDSTMNKALWQTRTYIALNTRGKIYQNIYADGSLIDSKLIDSSTIPQNVTGIGTLPIGTFMIGAEGDMSDDYYPTTIVRDKGYVHCKAKSFYVSYVSNDLGSKCILQSFTPQIESLPFLSTSHF